MRRVLLIASVLLACVLGCTTASTVTKPVTILHLTDVHGWIRGHTHNETLNADFGDLVDLVKHAKQRAADNGGELFLFDTGDLVEGTGLSDATSTHGLWILKSLIAGDGSPVPFDGLTMGNHDMGHDNTIQVFRDAFIPAYKEQYLTGNTRVAAHIDPKTPLMNQAFRVIETAAGTRVLVVGFIFHFMEAADDVFVMSMQDALASPAWKEVLTQQNIDLIVSLNHIDPERQNVTMRMQRESLESVFGATPAVYLTGHRHVRYFKQFSEHAFTVESGRYFETVGLIQFDLTHDTDHAAGSASISPVNVTFMDTELSQFYALVDKDAQSFPTPSGAAMRKYMQDAYDLLRLGQLFGCSPRTFYSYLPANDTRSLYYLWINDIMPHLYMPSAETSAVQLFVQNSASFRSNLYEGKVVRDDIISAIPFNDSYFYYNSVPGVLVKKLLITMISNPIQSHRDVRARYRQALRARPDHPNAKHVLGGDEPDSPHVCPDPAREALPSYFFSVDPEDVDMKAYYDVIGSRYDAGVIGGWFEKLYPSGVPPPKVQPYPSPLGPLTSTQLLGDYIRYHWKC